MLYIGVAWWCTTWNPKLGVFLARGAHEWDNPVAKSINKHVTQGDNWLHVTPSFACSLIGSSTVLVDSHFCGWRLVLHPPLMIMKFSVNRGTKYKDIMGRNHRVRCVRGSFNNLCQAHSASYVICLHDIYYVEFCWFFGLRFPRFPLVEP